MKNLPPSHSPRRDHGVALVLVLCFVVLITGLVVAYFSRTLNTRQLSNASTSTEEAEQLANSATDVILGDLKQEIVNGSTQVAGLPAGVTVYTPTAAANAVPQRNVAPTPVPAMTPAVGPIPNLVRRSLRTDTTAANVNYVPSPGVTSRASAATSSTPSANGRFVSTARWNRHYLVPTAADPGPTPTITASTPIAAFTAPDWVFVTAEKGPDVLTGPKSDASGTVTPIGRYAYAIYDEGGLLDVNHTGFPSASTFSHIGAKPAPGYGDLTQLPSPSPASTPAPSPSLLTTATVDNLLGWRNFATLQPSGSFPAFYTTAPSATPQTTSSAPDTAYYNLLTSGSTSLLQVAPTVYNSKTDQMFLSRQQLIGYFAAAGLDPTYLQYLATFTRGLSQPSYAPETGRPPVLAYSAVYPGTMQGGNDSYSNTSITPNFLTARVTSTFTRYDLTSAVVGEPLVKKRFPLNRLAWLTYRGPIADSNGNLNPNADSGVAAEIAAYNNAGIPTSFLQQGTPANVLTYFGLQWDVSSSAPRWSYVHGSVGASGGPILNISNASKTTDVARTTPAREPDFFELLKGSINPGSIAKTSWSNTLLNPPPSSNASYKRAQMAQYAVDTSLDIAILQIGANIIDQFDADSYPTQISYNLAGATGFVYGVENLPYISRVRTGVLRLVEANPPETTMTPFTADTRTIVNTGVAAVMNFPEIWNPHDWSSNNLSQSFGVVGPKQFEIYAASATNGPPVANAVYAWDQYNDSSPGADTKKSPGFNSAYGLLFGMAGSGYGGESRVLTEANTKMTFTVDYTSAASEANFREPTMLWQAGMPSGSALASSALVYKAGDPNGLGQLILGNSANAGFFSSAAGGGLESAVTSATPGSEGLVPAETFTSANVPAANTGYVGFYIGVHPLRWWYDGAAGGAGASMSAKQTQFGPVHDVVYTLECADGNGGMIPYDTKAMTSRGEPNDLLYSGVIAGLGVNGGLGQSGNVPASPPTEDVRDYGTRYYETIDPRTARFGMMDPWISSNANSIPPRGNYSLYSAQDWTIRTTREDTNSGTAFYFFPFLGSPYTTTTSHAQDGDWFPASAGWYHDLNLADDNSFRPGLLAQNNPYATPNGSVTSSRVPANTNPATSATYPPFYYADADNVIRRASGGNVPNGSTTPASTLTGLATAFARASGTSGPGYSTGTASEQIDSRPVILNRPFRSVTELGYVFSGTPWKNLDFFFPESGDVAMMDVFCVNDNSDTNAMTAGSVNLNTRQVPVLQAILAGANKDQWNDATSVAGTAQTTVLGGNNAEAQQIAQLLVNRTVSGPTTGPNANKGGQPLQYVSDLVGRYVSTSYWTGAAASNAPLVNAGINPQMSYDGFSADLATYLSASTATDAPVMHNIQRFGESAVRALSNAGQTRVWNLMFDIVAQTGRYSTQATSLDQFNVEGEQHYWVHVAIDRYTGQVIDKQVEVVKE